MRTIHKFLLPLSLEKEFALFFSANSQVLQVAVKGHKPYMWLDLHHTTTDAYETKDFFLAKDYEKLPSGRHGYRGCTA